LPAISPPMLKAARNSLGFSTMFTPIIKWVAVSLLSPRNLRSVPEALACVRVHQGADRECILYRLRSVIERNANMVVQSIPNITWISALVCR
jgi:hypothetical protein